MTRRSDTKRIDAYLVGLTTLAGSLFTLLIVLLATR